MTEVGAVAFISDDEVEGLDRDVRIVNARRWLFPKRLAELVTVAFVDLFARLTVRFVHEARKIAEGEERMKEKGRIKKFPTANPSVGGFDVLLLRYSLVPKKP